MTKNGILAVAAAAMLSTTLLASGAGAATMTAAQTCTALQGQFNAAIAAKPNATNAAAAKKLAATAATDCKTNKPKTGAANYRKALQEIGEKPKY